MPREGGCSCLLPSCSSSSYLFSGKSAAQIMHGVSVASQTNQTRGGRPASGGEAVAPSPSSCSIDRFIPPSANPAPYGGSSILLVSPQRRLATACLNFGSQD